MKTLILLEYLLLVFVAQFDLDSANVPLFADDVDETDEAFDEIVHNETSVKCVQRVMLHSKDADKAMSECFPSEDVAEKKIRQVQGVSDETYEAFDDIIRKDPSLQCVQRVMLHSKDADKAMSECFPSGDEEETKIRQVQDPEDTRVKQDPLWGRRRSSRRRSYRRRTSRRRRTAASASFTPNGCSIPYNLPFLYKKAFTPDCNQHDICYTDKTDSRQTCDKIFLKDMLNTCLRRASSFWDTLAYPVCVKVGTLYYAGVRIGGSSHYG